MQKNKLQSFTTMDPLKIKIRSTQEFTERSNRMDKDKMQTLKQIMQANKMAFDYNYTIMIGAYDLNKVMFQMFLNQSIEGVPAETKSAIEEWFQMYRKGCDELKRMTDEGYGMVEKSMSYMEKQ
jgi:hypothetical protein